MKKIIFFVLAASIFLPANFALAGSCGCRYNAAENAGSAPTCTKQGKATSSSDCSALEGTSDGYGTYDLCTYYSNDECLNACQVQGLKDDTKNYVSCSVDSDCSARTNGIGIAKCCNNSCYFDDTGMQSYLNARIGFQQLELQTPKLEIKIPGISFTGVNNSLDESGYIHIPFLAQYLAGVYSFSMVATSILAAIVIIINGFRISISMGGDQKSQAMKKIGQVVIGLCILWGSYLLFYTINPDLVTFRALRVQYIKTVPLEEEEEFTQPTPVVSEGNAVEPFGTNMSAEAGVIVDSSILPALRAAAESLKSQGISLYIASGLRTKEKQLQLIAENCQNQPGDPNGCNPKPNKPTTCILKDMKLENCPHTTGKAVDVWGKIRGSQCVMQKNCSKDSNTDACRKDPCQAAVIEAMRAQGFCNLSIEAWHFELPQMSCKQPGSKCKCN
jgi:D-alanyl-D-alanine dipeptidase